MEDASKDRLGVAFVGHVDSGKSTIVGHLAELLGCFPERQLLKNEREAQAIGKGSFKYAFAFDRSRPERERGITILVNTLNVQTTKFDSTIIDTPGHRDFTKNTINGISQSDVVVLVVSAGNGEFEVGISKTGQSRDHTVFAFAFGVKQLIVAVNKMDAHGIEYSEKRFLEIKQQVSKFLKRTGCDPKTVPFVPISGWSGENLIQTSQRMPWWKGPTLLEAIDSMEPPTRLIDLPLRFTISNVHRIKGVGIVIVGKVESGVLRPGMVVNFSPCGLTSTVFSIEMYHKVITEAIPGDIVGFNVQGIRYSDIKPGYIVGDASQDPPQEVTKFIAQLVVIYHPTEILAGYTPVFDCHTAHVPCKWTKIESRIDKRTGEVLEENPKSLKTGDSGIVEMTPIKPICVETFADCPRLGRFTIRDARRTIAIGIIKRVEKKTKQGTLTKAVRRVK